MRIPHTAAPLTAPAPSPLRRATWDHPQSAWVCETAELLVGFGAPPGEGTRRLLWGSAGLPHGRPCVHGPRAGHRIRARAQQLNADALAVLGEACAAEAELVDDEFVSGAGERHQAALDLIDDALTALREALDLAS